MGPLRRGNGESTRSNLASYLRNSWAVVLLFCHKTKIAVSVSPSLSSSYCNKPNDAPWSAALSIESDTSVSLLFNVLRRPLILKMHLDSWECKMLKQRQSFNFFRRRSHHQEPMFHQTCLLSSRGSVQRAVPDSSE